MKRFALKIVPLVLVVLLLSSCIRGMSLLGVDNNNKERRIKVPDDKYVEKLGNYLAVAHDSSLSSLEQVDERRANPWKLHSVQVGIGLKGAIKIASIVTLGASTRIRFQFQKDKG